MQIFIEYPAIAAILPAPRGEYIPVHIAGVEQKIMRLSRKRVWLDTKANRLKTQANEYSDHFFIEISEELYTSFIVASGLESAQKMVDALEPGAQQRWLAERREAAQDIPALNKRLAEASAQRRAETEERKRQDAIKQAEKEAKEAEEEKADFQAAIENFRAGGMIPWHHFERACKDNGIIMHMRTIGNGRAAVLRIGKTSASQYDGKKVSDGVWQALRELRAALGITN